jgi:hypothetical protein
MKILSLFLFLSLAVLGMAQNTSDRSLEPRVFKPLSLPGQQRPLEAPSSPLLSQKSIYYIILVLLLVLLLGGALFLCWKIPSIGARILIVVGALAASAFAGFVLLTMIGLTAPPDNSPQGLARRALSLMAEELGMSIEHTPVAIQDDDCRVGIIIHDQALVLADYEENKALYAPYAYLDTVWSKEGVSKELPSLPLPKSDHWVIETKAAKQSNDAASLYQIEWHFRDLNPSRITLRYAQPDYFFPEVVSIERLIQQKSDASRGIFPEE